MAKTLKRNRAQERAPRPEYPIALPRVAARDELAEMTDDRLSEAIDALRRDMQYVFDWDRSLSLRPWEVEVAYATRELGSRISRRRLHEAYLAQAGK